MAHGVGATVVTWGFALIAVIVILVAMTLARREGVQARQASTAAVRERALDGRAAVAALAARLAHDINQPLGTILNNAETARLLLGHDPVPVEDLRAVLDAIVVEEERAAEIVRRFREAIGREPAAEPRP